MLKIRPGGSLTTHGELCIWASMASYFTCDDNNRLTEVSFVLEIEWQLYITDADLSSNL